MIVRALRKKGLSRKAIGRLTYPQMLNELEADHDDGGDQFRVNEKFLAVRDKWLDNVCAHLGVTHEALPTIPVEQVAAAIESMGKRSDPEKLPEMIRVYCQRKNRTPHG